MTCLTLEIFMSLIDLNIDTQFEEIASSFVVKTKKISNFLEATQSDKATSSVFHRLKETISDFQNHEVFIQNIYKNSQTLDILSFVLPKTKLKTLQKEFNFLTSYSFLETKFQFTSNCFSHCFIHSNDLNHDLFSKITPSLKQGLDNNTLDLNSATSLFLVAIAYYLETSPHNAIFFKEQLLQVFSQANDVLTAKQILKIFGTSFDNNLLDNLNLPSFNSQPPATGYTMAFCGYGKDAFSAEKTSLVDLSNFKYISTENFISQEKLNKDEINYILSKHINYHIYVSKYEQHIKYYAFVPRNTIFFNKDYRPCILNSEQYDIHQNSDAKKAFTNAFYNAMINPPSEIFWPGSVIRMDNNLMLVIENKFQKFSEHSKMPNIICISTDQDPKSIKFDCFSIRVGKLYLVSFTHKSFLEYAKKATDIEKQTLLYFSGAI